MLGVVVGAFDLARVALLEKGDGFGPDLIDLAAEDLRLQLARSAAGISSSDSWSL